MDGRASHTAAPQVRIPASTSTPRRPGLRHRRIPFGQIKLKVRADVDNDARRLMLARDAVGPDVRIAVDANQRWRMAQAISAIEALAPYHPYWAEEPTSPDEILGLACSTSITCASISPTRCASPAADASRRPRGDSPSRSGPESLRDYQFPHGSVWQPLGSSSSPAT